VQEDSCIAGGLDAKTSIAEKWPLKSANLPMKESALLWQN
jgi:hypothetical protein